MYGGFEFVATKTGSAKLGGKSHGEAPRCAAASNSSGLGASRFQSRAEGILRLLEHAASVEWSPCRTSGRRCRLPSFALHVSFSLL